MNVLSSTIASSVDYTPVNGQIIFAVGEYTKNITIPILGDSEREEEETFHVELTTDCCADVTIGQVQVYITDSDGRNAMYLSLLSRSDPYSYATKIPYKLSNTTNAQF